MQIKVGARYRIQQNLGKFAVYGAKVGAKTAQVVIFRVNRKKSKKESCFCKEHRI